MTRGFSVSSHDSGRRRWPAVRLGVLIGVGVVVAGGLAVRTFQEKVRHEAALEALADDLGVLARFNELEARLATGLEEAGDDLRAGVEVLRELAPELAALSEPFARMAARGLPEGLDFDESGQEDLASAFHELVGRYAEEAALYGELARAAAVEPPGAAWLEILPVLDELDRILSFAAESRERLQQRLDELERPAH